MSAPKTAQLYRMVMDDHLCPYGLKSKHLLESQGYEVDDHHLKSREAINAFKNEHNVRYHAPKPLLMTIGLAVSMSCKPILANHQRARMKPPTGQLSHCFQ